MGNVRNTVNGLKPTFYMIIVQTTFAIVNVFYKLAADDGMKLSVLIAYRFTFAAAFMLPLAFLVERFTNSALYICLVLLRVILVVRYNKLYIVIMNSILHFLYRNKRTKLTWTVIFQAFLCGLFGYASCTYIFCFHDHQLIKFDEDGLKDG